MAITVTNANDAPSITSGATASFAENGTGTVYTATATDPDASSTLTYSIAGIDAALFNINSTSGAVTFKSAPNFESRADAGANNVYDITVSASDGTLTSAAQAVAITVTNANEAPSITSSATASFAENGTGTVYTATATDPDASSTLTYSIAGTDAALFNINSTSGAVTFKSAPNFESPADAGANNVYDITVSTSDGTLTSAAQAVAITVTNANDAPSITSSATASFAENGTGTVYTATATDPDASSTLTYSIAGTDAALFNINSTSGAVTFKSAPNFESRADAGANNVYDITVSASDGTLTSAAQAVAITVTNVNEAPTLTTVTALTGAVQEVPFEITYETLAANANENDVDGDTLSFRVEAISTGTLEKWNGSAWTAATAVSTTLATGEKLRWMNALYANGTLNAFTVTAYDSALYSSTPIQVQVTVSAIQALTGTANADVLDGRDGNDLLSGLAGNDLLIGGTGTDTMTGGTGTDSFENPSGDMTIALGGSGNSGTISGFDVITDFTVASGSAVSESLRVNASGTTTSIPTNITGSNGNGSNSVLSISGAVVASHRISNGIITFDDNNTFATALSLTSNAHVAAVVDYLRRNDIGNDGATVAFTANFSSVARTYVYTQPTTNAPGSTSTAFGLVELQNTTATRLTLTASTTTSGALYLSDSLAAPTLSTINSLTGATEDTAFEITYASLLAASNAADVEGDELSFRIETVSTGTLQRWDGSAWADVTEGTTTVATGERLQWTPASNANGTLNAFTVKAFDRVQASSAAVQVQVTAAAVNDPPSITSGATASFAENGTDTVYTATATDPDASSTLTYSIAGTDAALFNINSSTGAVTFKNAPNFESPQDAGANNVYDITVTASDGTLSSAARAVAITVTDADDTPPTAPFITSVADDVSPVTGVVASGGSTNDTVLLIAGNAEANSTVTLYNGSTSLGTATANSSGAWSFTTATLTNGGTYSFNATATDAAGNVSAASTNYTVTVDTSSPAALTLTLGSGFGDGATAAEATAATGAVSVVAQAGTNVAVSFSRSQGGSVTKNLIGSGAAQAVVLSTADLATLGDGVINVSAVASDSAGNSSDPATATFTLDTSAPQPLVLTLQADSGSSSKDSITSNPQVLVGQLASGTVWEVSTNAGSSWTTGSGTNFSLSEGSYATNQVQVRQRDTSGNLSTATGNSSAWLIDTTSPQFIAGSSATASAILENSGSNRVIYTPQMAATEAATGGVLRYSLLGGGDASNFSVGTFNGAVTLLSNPDYETKSSYTFTLRATDVAGNATNQTVNLQVLNLDEVAPNTPQIDVVASDDIINGTEATGTVVISGTAEADSLVTVRWASNPARTATATGGKWSVTYSSSAIPANGTSLISATASDAAGNVSAAGSRSVLVNRIAPNRPLLNTVAGDNYINASEWASGIALQGTAELGSSVTANLAGMIRSTQVDANGNWLLTYGSAALPADGLVSLTVSSTDPAGNISTAANRLLQVDTAAPQAPTLQAVAGDNRINATEAATGIQLNGTAEAGSTVQALWAGNSVGSAVTSSAGIWAINVAAGALPANGMSTLMISSRDAAGNTSASLSRDIVLDGQVIGAPLIASIGTNDVVNALTAANGVLVRGTAEAGSLVQVQWGDLIRSAEAGSDGSWSLIYNTSQLPMDGERTLTARAITTSGNVSSTGSRKVLIDTIATSTLITALQLSADTGTSASDFVTSQAEQILSGTLSAALQAGETVQVSLDGGKTWQSAQASSNQLNFSTPVSLRAGDTPGSIQVMVMDVAGNAGAIRSQGYRLEAAGNGNSVASMVLSADSGTVGDLRTNVSQQTMRGDLKSPLLAGERVQFRALVSNSAWSNWGTASTSTNSTSFTFQSSLREGINQLEVRHLDSAGNASESRSLSPVLDSLAPQVIRITLNGSGQNRPWQAGDIATINLEFSESVNVHGTPALKLSLSDQGVATTYTGNSGAQLQFDYTLTSTDAATGSPVIIISPGSLDLTNASIKDSAGNFALSAISNQIFGSSSSDVISGTNQVDVITGAAGADQLSGGLGSDLFVFRSGSESCLGSSTNGFDTITDFQLGSDQLQLGSLAPVSNFTSLGSISELSSSALSSLLNPTSFQTPGCGVQFSIGSNIFLAVNDTNAGFSVLEDLLVRIGS
ncbi:cadherin domain-containing protein [Synechococcus sp. GreenBA-s]|nr:cadherin domain-containing protein [Synechococcus sp. GreenBA-s]